MAIYKNTGDESVQLD